MKGPCLYGNHMQVCLRGINENYDYNTLFLIRFNNKNLT